MRSPKWRPALAVRAAGEAGQAITELALTLPVLLAITSAIIDGGWAFHQAGLVTAAAEAAQRAVAIQDAGTGHCSGAPPADYAATAQSAAAAATSGLDPARLSVALQYLEPACSGRMRTLAVSVSYPIIPLTPWFAPLLSRVRLRSQAMTAVEELSPPWWGQAGTVQTQQAQIASLTTAYGQASAQMQAQQAQIASLASAYSQAAAALQSDQAQISSLNAAHQAEAVQAAALSSNASYYYAQWQSASEQASALAQDVSYYYAQWQAALQMLAPYLPRPGDPGDHER